ncbi:MAG: thermonuclease family protein [Paracoccaceae bacterium]
MLKFIFRAFFRKKTSTQYRQTTNRRPIQTPPVRKYPPKLQPSPKSEVATPSQPIGASCEPHSTITGKCYVIDGDTIQIGKVRLRLAGIDAPEMEHPWGKKAKWELVNLCKGQKITAELEPDISYDRIVATCLLPDGRDLSAEMVKIGMALDWPKFSGGKYAHLEPEGVRKKHWKAAARQRGHMHVFNK